ncbi:MAG TPA: hypothetical protein VIL31_10625 [Cyclobacteriaceae bacterium]|jgi:hypothetical protein
MRLTINSSLVLRVLTIAWAVIIVLNLLVVLLRYQFGIEHDLFDRVFNKLYIDNEQNLPTYFNSLLLLIASVITGLIYRLVDEVTEPKLMWLILSLTFLFLSLDESASVHEFFVKFLPRYMGIGGKGVFANAWVIVYGIGAGLLAIFLVPSLRKLKFDLMTGMALSGAVYVTGAIGCEMLGSYLMSNGILDIRYALVATLEETLEMGGLILFIRCLLIYVREDFRSASVSIS